MTDPTHAKSYVVPAIEITIKIGALALLIGWCFLILKPFLSPVVWGIIIAVALYPIHSRLTAILGNRQRPAAVIMTVLALLIIILPGVKLAGSMVDGVKTLNEKFQSGSVRVPSPPAASGAGPSSVRRLTRFGVRLPST